MKLRGSLVLPHTNTTTRSIGSFEAVRLEKNETRKGAFLGRKFPKKAPTHLRGRFFFPSSAPCFFVNGIFVRFSTRGVQKHHKQILGEIHVESFLPKKLRKQKCMPFFFLRLFFIAFLAVSLHEEPKNTIKIFPKIRPENLKKSQKKVGR